MNGKTILFGLAVLLVGGAVWFFRGDSNDAEIARQMAREQNRAEAVSSTEPAASTATPDYLQLTKTVYAERDSERNQWIVSAGGQSFIELPFAPPVDGKLPDVEPVTDIDPTENPGYVGADACAECHKKKHAGFIETAHHLTSGVVSPGSIRGHFVGPQSIMQTRDRALGFRSIERDDQLVQQVGFEDWQMDFPLDVWTGSAKTGQTMLYWHGDALFQAYVSYLTKLDTWIPSPGYRDTTVIYSRKIRSACLECHITYIDSKRKPNYYHRDSAIWGISCERCHGPGKDHVEYHTANPGQRESKHIIHPATLTRQQQLEICAQCHSGSFSLLQDAFTFVPGEELDKHHRQIQPDASGIGGIHTSNQLTRLKLSKCFQESEMTCTTCHNPHENQHGRTEVFVKSCYECHELDHCGQFEERGEQIVDECIGCHMPIAENEDMKQAMGVAFTVEMIDHYIRVVEE